MQETDLNWCGSWSDRTLGMQSSQGSTMWHLILVSLKKGGCFGAAVPSVHEGELVVAMQKALRFISERGQSTQRLELLSSLHKDGIPV